jgi:hypothetical protein
MMTLATGLPHAQEHPPMEQPITLPVDTEADPGVSGAPNTEALLALLRSWDDDDPEEQRETLLYLQRVLDEDRLGARKLFPSGAERHAVNATA